MNCAKRLEIYDISSAILTRLIDKRPPATESQSAENIWSLQVSEKPICVFYPKLIKKFNSNTPHLLTANPPTTFIISANFFIDFKAFDFTFREWTGHVESFSDFFDALIAELE